MHLTYEERIKELINIEIQKKAIFRFKAREVSKYAAQERNNIFEGFSIR